jgi:hypothetical protein
VVKLVSLVGLRITGFIQKVFGLIRQSGVKVGYVKIVMLRYINIRRYKMIKWKNHELGVEIFKIDNKYEVWASEQLIGSYKTKRSALKMFQTKKFELIKQNREKVS